MAMNRPRILALTAAMVLAALGMAASPAFAQPAGGNFLSVKSSHSYSETANALQQSIRSNGLMVMGTVNQKAILSMTGLNLAGAESFLVGNPRVGKELFSMNPAVAAVVPARISVWVSDGATYVGYFRPSAVMGEISPALAKPGHMLDGKFQKIVQAATH